MQLLIHAGLIIGSSVLLAEFKLVRQGLSHDTQTVTDVNLHNVATWICYEYQNNQNNQNHVKPECILLRNIPYYNMRHFYSVAAIQ